METTDATPEATPEFNVSPSILTSLRAARSVIGAGATPLDLEIPGYGGQLVARFAWKPANELAATSKSLQAIKNPTQQQLAAAADALATCNEEILIRDGETLESLQHGGVPVTFANGEGLLLALGLPRTSATRDCVMAVFGNDYAIMGTALKLSAWLEDASQEVDVTTLGE